MGLPFVKNILYLGIVEVSAYLSALCAGFGLALFYVRSRRLKDRKRVRQMRSVGDFDIENQTFRKKRNSVNEYLISYFKKRTKAAALSSTQGTRFEKLLFLGSKNFDTIICRAGLAAQVSTKGVCDARLRLVGIMAFVGALFGSIFSTELAFAALLAGGISAWLLPKKALQRLEKKRKLDLEAHLSEMLEVVALGLRSGLSFDSSFELYPVYFDTDLAQASASAQRQWRLGLRTREEALRDLASSYNSVLFSRVIESIIRSIRFGTSLADSFDSAALEARLIHKAEREEAVAKAPVKMLVPTAALILPAMLILVLGPILLEMMQGF